MRRADTRRGSTSTRRIAFVAGPGGNGLNDYYSPEVDSNVVGTARNQDLARCFVRHYPRLATASSWNASFEDIQCYDALKVNALLNEIAGKTTAARRL